MSQHSIQLQIPSSLSVTFTTCINSRICFLRIVYNSLQIFLRGTSQTGPMPPVDFSTHFISEKQKVLKSQVKLCFSINSLQHLRHFASLLSVTSVCVPTVISPASPLRQETQACTLPPDPAYPTSTHLEGYIALLKNKKVNKRLSMYIMYRVACRGPQKLKRSMKSWGEREEVQPSGLFAVHGCFVSWKRRGGKAGVNRWLTSFNQRNLSKK